MWGNGIPHIIVEVHDVETKRARVWKVHVVVLQRDPAWLEINVCVRVCVCMFFKPKVSSTTFVGPYQSLGHLSYTLNSVVSHLWQPKCTWYHKLKCSVKMDVRYCSISVASDTKEFEFILLSSPLVCSTPLGLPGGMWHMQAPTFNKWHKRKTKNKNKKVTQHILTHGAMRRCGLTSLVVCNNDKFCDIRQRNVTIKSKAWTTNTSSLGFWEI